MTMISDKDVKLIREHFKKSLQDPVSIDHFTQGESTGGLPIHECQFCHETGELLGELAGLSDRITLRTHDLLTDAAQAKEMGITRIPAFVLSGKALGHVRFIGIPSGYEFSSVIEDLVDVARGTTDLAPKAVAELAGLKNRVHIQVFGTPT
jgi:alkyl hydroperoxide reductase subunit AhpF